eukprot:GEMP01088348.1.p1 GENE.GEMP01088348.1~~GEMP01088348.1.p1  ORF type:complete len:115 (+),score=19.05 GEMP01088348.1:490-834(+)
MTRALANVPWKHPLVNNTERHTIVVVGDERDVKTRSVNSTVNTTIIPSGVEISHEPLDVLLRRLREDKGVRFAEVFGGQLTGLFIARRLLNEVRLTIHGALIGGNVKMFNLKAW